MISYEQHLSWHQDRLSAFHANPFSTHGTNKCINKNKTEAHVFHIFDISTLRWTCALLPSSDRSASLLWFHRPHLRILTTFTLDTYPNPYIHRNFTASMWLQHASCYIAPPSPHDQFQFTHIVNVLVNAPHRISIQIQWNSSATPFPSWRPHNKTDERLFSRL